MKNFKIYLFSIGLFFITVVAFAQYTEVINSNRPGVSQGAFSVGTNVLQFETGPYLVKEKHDLLQYEVSGFGIDFSARYGLLWEQLEINVEGTYQNDTFTDNRSSISQDKKRRNFKNFTIGAKYLIYDPYKNEEYNKINIYSYHANRKLKWESLIPAVSIYAGANFDAKDNPYTAYGIEGLSPKVIIATQNNFYGGWVFVINLVKDRIGTDFSDFHYILTLTKSIGRRGAFFVENQGIKSDFYADNLFRVGGAFLWTKNFQLDTSITFNTKNTPTVFNANFGASYRFDFHKDKLNGGSNDNDID